MEKEGILGAALLAETGVGVEELITAVSRLTCVRDHEGQRVAQDYRRSLDAVSRIYALKPG